MVILFKKLLRTAWKYKAQFISMFVMLILGVGAFSGFNIEWKSIENNLNVYLEETGYADYRIYYQAETETYFTEEDLQSIRDIEGVDAASRYISLGVNVANTNQKLDLCVIEDYGEPTSLYFVKGEYDSDALGIYLSDQFASANKYKTGDFITLSYGDLSLAVPIIGLVKSSEYIVCITGDQMMPDYKTFGYGFVGSDVYKNQDVFPVIYPTILVKSDLSIEEMNKKVNSLFGNDVVVVQKDLDTDYHQSQSEIFEGQIIASVLPVIFVLVCILTMITTMKRIVNQESSQIGILKALGFKNKTIGAHYSLYAVAIGLIGSIIGIGAGFFLGWFIDSPQGLMGDYLDLPTWKLSMPWFVIPAVIILLALFFGISFLAIKRTMNIQPAPLLKNNYKKPVKHLKIEKSKGFKKLSLPTRWNIRDMLRNKPRSLMSIIGIVGSTLLLFCSFGYKDLTDNYLAAINSRAYAFNTCINVNESALNEDILSFIEEHEADAASSTPIKLENTDDGIEFKVLYNPHKYVNIVNFKYKPMTINDDGAYISQRVKDRGYKIGDYISFTKFGSSDTYTVKVVGYFCGLMSESITVTPGYAETLSSKEVNKIFDYKYTDIYSNMDKEDIEALKSPIVSTISTHQDLIDSFDSFLKLINIIIIMLIVISLLLGGIVLYNLTTLGYIEKMKELLTLKVLGLKDRRVRFIVLMQSVILAIIGIAIGMPLGFLTLKIMVKLLGSEYEMSVLVKPTSVILSIGIVLVFTILISYLTTRGIKKSNLSEAMKYE